MLERFYPGEYVDSTYAIDFDRLYEEGYRGVIFDIDNTLVNTLDMNMIPLQKIIREEKGKNGL